MTKIDDKKSAAATKKSGVDAIVDSLTKTTSDKTVVKEKNETQGTVVKKDSGASISFKRDNKTAAKKEEAKKPVVQQAKTTNNLTKSDSLIKKSEPAVTKKSDDKKAVK